MTIELSRSTRHIRRPVPLRADTLGQLGERVGVPSYDRTQLVPSIVHFGVGGFHRAHQAVYLDEIAARGHSLDWGVVGVGLHHPEMGEVLEAQDNLYTVVERDARAEEPRVVGVMTRYIYAPDAPADVLDVLADPVTRLVTLTITGGGYHVDEATGRFDADAQEIADDLLAPRTPSSAVGYIVEALDRRRRAGHAPFTVLSCDNMQDSGAAARIAVTAFARLRDPELAAWIEGRVSFPGSTVDRITPTTSPGLRDEMAASTGVDDRWPITTEPFSQWIIEDDFCNGRPPLDLVGARFVADALPYKRVKTRLLNGTHCALGYLGTLAGHRRTDEAMGDPLVARYVEELMREEIAPLLAAPDDLDLAAYQAELLERFANPRVGDPLSRLCGRGSTKMPAYLLPSLHEARAAGTARGLLTLAVAAWMRYLRGVQLDGQPVPVADARAEELVAAARTPDADVRPLLGIRDIFGDMVDDAVLVDEVRAALRDIDEHGARGAIAVRLARTEAAR